MTHEVDDSDVSFLPSAPAMPAPGQTGPATGTGTGGGTTEDFETAAPPSKY